MAGTILFVLISVSILTLAHHNRFARIRKVDSANDPLSAPAALQLTCPRRVMYPIQRYLSANCVRLLVEKKDIFIDEGREYHVEVF